MWRVVVAGRPDESEHNGTLLSSELPGPPPPPPPPPPPTMGYPHPQHQQHHYQGHYPPGYYHPQQLQAPQYQHHPEQAPPSQRSLQKRPHPVSSMSDSDCDDVFSEESGKEPCNSPQLQSSGGAGGQGGNVDSCQHSSRKRRRGMIEKKRRDRINASLSELRRLVPSAARDPHSGKLEKAEILQLTVEHLRALKNHQQHPQIHPLTQHVKGDVAESGYQSPSPSKAMDYHAVGWGECAAEVGRYLVSMEGLDERDPLRLRLLSHLQGYHRELAPEVAPAIKYEQPSPNATNNNNNNNNNTTTSANDNPAAATSLSWSTGQYPGPAGSLYQPHPHHHHHHGNYLQPTGGPAPGSSYHHQQQTVGKPYRPWGAELAY